MKKSKEVALGWCGLVFTLVATVFHVIGFATPHWLESYEQAHSRFDRLGLWTACFNKFGYDRDQLGKQYDGCHWIYSYEYKPIFDWLNPQWFLAVQVMMTLAMCFNVLASLFLVLGKLGRCLPDTDFFSQFLAAVTMFGTTLLSGLAVTIFGTKSETDRQWFPRPDQNFLTWSFGLVVVSGFFSLFGAMCLLVDSFRIKYHEDKEKRLAEPYKAYKMRQVMTEPQY